MAHIIGNVSLNKNVYSLYDIAKFEKISEDRIKFLMQTCLKRIQNTAPCKSSSGIQSFFNKIGSADNTVNVFFNHSRLRPFAGAIRLEMEKTYQNKKDVYYAMFYVPKSVYSKWKRGGMEYNAAPVPDMDETGLSTGITPTRTVRLPKIPMLEQFESVLKSIDFRLSEGILLAIEEYMKNHSDVFGEPVPSEYDESLVRENKMSLIQVYIPPETTNAVFKALQRANMECIKKIKFSEFVDVALREKLDRLPIKYTNPEMYRELLELEKAEQEFLKKGGV